MKTTLISLVSILSGLTGVSAYAKNVMSPDRNWAVLAEQTISIADANGQPVLPWLNNTSLAERIEIAWAGDSAKVVMASNLARGSGIFGAWVEGGKWHKTLQSDDDQGPIIRQAQRVCGGQLVSGHRSFDGWIGSNAVKVKGEMTFSSGKRINLPHKECQNLRSTSSGSLTGRFQAISNS